jgi:hypothetical protein
VEVRPAENTRILDKHVLMLLRGSTIVAHFWVPLRHPAPKLGLDRTKDHQSGSAMGGHLINKIALFNKGYRSG